MATDPAVAETFTDALTRPAAIRRLHLQLEDAPILALDPRITWMASLEELHIGANRSDIQRLDGTEALAHLRGLRRLGISLDGLPALPAPLFQLTGLDVLTLRGSAIRTLDGIGNLTALTRLELALWNLESLPPEIGRLKRLEYLSLRGSQVARLPEEIGDLSSLVKLFAEGNRLETIPASIERIASLECLLLGGNQLRSVSANLALLPKLRTLDLRGNAGLGVVPAELTRKPDLELEIEPEKLPPAAQADVRAASKAAFAELDARAKAREINAGTFVLEPGENGPTDSKVGGMPWLAPNEAWPRCGLCEAPMSFFLQLDFGPYPGYREHVLLQVFSCESRPSVRRMHALATSGDARLHEVYRDNVRNVTSRMSAEEAERLAHDIRSGVPQTPGHRQFLASRGLTTSVWFLFDYDCHDLIQNGDNSPDRLVRIVDAIPGPVQLRADTLETAKQSVASGPDAQRIKRIDWKVDRPTMHDLGKDAWELERALTAEEREVVQKWTSASDKVGGWPRWLQDQGWQPCPVCRKPTSELVLALEGSEDDLFPWPDQILYVTRCPEHPRALVWARQGG